MSGRHTESHGLKTADVPTTITALITRELLPLLYRGVDDDDIESVIGIALRELVKYGEQTLPSEVLQRIA